MQKKLGAGPKSYAELRLTHALRGAVKVFYSFSGSLRQVKYLSFAQSNGNVLRPEQGEQPRGQSFGEGVGRVEPDL
jgi:hypothetical protein